MRVWSGSGLANLRFRRPTGRLLMLTLDIRLVLTTVAEDERGDSRVFELVPGQDE